MRLIYPDVGDCRALIIDENPTSRSILAGMLRDMGVGHITQTSRVLEARRALEAQAFDIVLCDYHFDNSPMSGQDLLDELRRAQLLPYSTVFVMVTGEASYAQVVEAAEAALDSYLIKPHTAAALEERLVQARQRKTVLRSVFEAIEAGDFAKAAIDCTARFGTRAQYGLFAARIGAELFLRLGQHDAAQRLYEAVQARHGSAWARLGIARVQAETGRLGPAGRTLADLIEAEPNYADAYDVLGRVQFDQGEHHEALDTYRSATKLTPASIIRLQKQGMLAHYLGETAEACDALERSVRIGISSKMFDTQALLLLALMQFDKRDAKALLRCCDNLAQARDKEPESVRLRRLAATADALRAVFERRGREAATERAERAALDAVDRADADAVARVAALAGEIGAEDFDFEAASNLLALLVRLDAAALAPPEIAEWIGTLAQRFCVSKASADMLCHAVRGHNAFQALIRDGHAGISTMAEKAMAHSVVGSPLDTVKTLLFRGNETRNAKLIELAGLVLNRHAEKIGDTAPLAEKIADLKARYCTKGTQAALGGRAGRAAGGLNLRA